jgi:hypothetical protein
MIFAVEHEVVSPLGFFSDFFCSGLSSSSFLFSYKAFTILPI